MDEEHAEQAKDKDQKNKWNNFAQGFGLLLHFTPTIRHYCSASMWSNWNHAVTTLNCLYSPWGSKQREYTTLRGFLRWYRLLFPYNPNPNLSLSSTLLSTLSLFLPSRPPPTPACYLHPPLPRAALTHRRTPPLTCRLLPQPTPTPVSFSELHMGLNNRGRRHLLYVCVTSDCMLKWNSTDWLADSVFLLPHFYPGLISPGVSVPVQVPGTDQQSMSHNLGQYWARLQWTTDSHCQPAKQKNEKRACNKKVLRKQYGDTRVVRKHRTEL